MIQTIHPAPHELTVGREDRLVRGCVALSLFLLAVFAVLASGGVGFVSVVIFALGGYFAVTAVKGWDPGYVRFGIDTRTDPQTEEEGRTGQSHVAFRELRRGGSADTDLKTH